MSIIRLRCQWVRPLAAMRLTLLLREMAEECLFSTGEILDDRAALQAHRQSAVLLNRLHGAYPLLARELLWSTGNELSQRDYEAQRGLIRCAGEALISLFRMDQSEMIGRQLRCSSHQAAGILELAQLQIREALAPIVRQLHFSAANGAPVLLSRAFATAAEDMFLSWVAIRLAQGEAEVNSILASIEAKTLSELRNLNACSFKELFDTADRFAESKLNEVCAELGHLAVIREVRDDLL